MTKPISPNDIAAVKRSAIPEVVFTVINNLITEKWNGASAKFTQDDAIAALVDTGMSRFEIFDKGYLDFEGAYRAEGWHVHYDKPGYNETYPANFTFSVKPSIR